MKRITLLSAVLLFVSIAVFAQDSDIYVKSVPISKVYNHQLGFRVVYMKSNSEMAVFISLKHGLKQLQSAERFRKPKFFTGMKTPIPIFPFSGKTGSLIISVCI